MQAESYEGTSFLQQSAGVNFILKNTTALSIPLIIPKVMNPNLSPYSESGVYLKTGQEVFFKFKGKKYLLLKVDSYIQEGEKLDLAKLIRQRKRDLGLNSKE